MLNQNEPRHVMMAISIGVLLLTPVFLLAVPMFIAKSLHELPTSWVVLAPAKGFLFYGIGLLFLFIAFFILFLLRLNKTAKWISAFSFLLCTLFIAEGTQRYIGVASDYLSFKRGLFASEQRYPWSEVELVTYREFPEEGGFSKFDFHFTDGEIMILPENGQVRYLHNSIRKKLTKEDIDFQRK
ncbi:small-conductance mechanosensitive channel [Sporosarcina luteola]|nr:small-conductance mechanosensitive channel [Sporosarcina luteola]